MKEMAVARMYENGTIERHIKKMVRLYRKRRDNFCALLTQKIGDQILFDQPDGGMSVWATFKDTDLNIVEKRVHSEGLHLNDGRMYKEGPIYKSTRLGFASLNIEEQDKAITILATAIHG